MLFSYAKYLRYFLLPVQGVGPGVALLEAAGHQEGLEELAGLQVGVVDALGSPERGREGGKVGGREGGREGEGGEERRVRREEG